MGRSHLPPTTQYHKSKFQTGRKELTSTQESASLLKNLLMSHLNCHPSNILAKENRQGLKGVIPGQTFQRKADKLITDS